MPQVKASPKTYDVIVVGSGAGGGIAAHVLTLAGAKVCMLEAGGDYNTAKQSDMFKWNYDAPHRAAGTKEKPFGHYDATLVGGWQVPGEPYTTGPGSEFMWYRARMLGGRTNHYGRISLRMGPYDFKPYSRDGKGFDWPITYDDLAPYYDKAEELIGVFGTQEGLENTPDGRFQPAPAPRAHERLIKKVCDKLKIPCIPSRLAILTKPLNGRPACHYCAECGRACAVNANFASPGVHIAPALKTGNLEVRTGAMCREVMVGPDGRAKGVSYIDTKTRREVTVNARVVVLAASCCETARIMLNSKSSLFPNGIANSTGLVGKYIMDTVGSSVSGYLPILEDLPPANDDGVGGMHMYMPWWLYQQQKAGKMPFARGYHIEIGGGRGMPGAGIFGGSQTHPRRRIRQGFQARRPQNVRRQRALRRPRRNDPQRGELLRDRPQRGGSVGHPGAALPLQVEPGRDPAGQTHAGDLPGNHRAAGGRVTSMSGDPSVGGIARGGEIIHEVGATKMGDDPKTSVLNQWCQAWDCKNLFITDAAPFASNADKNPTLSITALGWRTSDYIADQIKKRNL